jgi:hypothetical protein
MFFWVEVYIGTIFANLKENSWKIRAKNNVG